MARPFAGLIPALALASAWPAASAATPPDRYGPAPAAAPLPDVYASPLPTQASATFGRETARAAPTRLLSWPGKSDTAAALVLPPVADERPYGAPARKTGRGKAPSYRTAAVLPTPRYAPPAYAAAQAVAAPSATAATVSPQFAAPLASPAAPPLPYFAAPTPGTPPPASTALSGPLAAAPASSTQHARLYSVHREYGMQPDPAPIPPQFFAQTADLTEPATAEPTPSRAANAASRNAVNAARLAAADAN